MVRILGNSYERLKINDLHDTIYYKQQKVYTDQEFEGSQDLQREVRKGNITVLERFVNARSNESSSAQIAIDDIRRAVREELSGNNREPLSNSNASNDISALIPLLINSIKQEVSSVLSDRVIQGGPAPEYQRKQASDFIDESYIPTISTQGMVSNINTEAKEVSGDNVNSNLEALKALKGLKKKNDKIG